MELKTLWLQTFVGGRGDEKIVLKKVDAEDCRADIGTKIHGEGRLTYLLGLCGLLKFDLSKHVEEKPTLVQSDMTKRLGLVGAIVNDKKALLASLLAVLAQIGEASEQEISPSASTLCEACWWKPLERVELSLAFIGFLVVLHFGLRLREWFLHGGVSMTRSGVQAVSAEVEGPRIVLKHNGTMSQVTYRRNLATPRFQPLSESQQG